jgi:hypothetical protein
MEWADYVKRETLAVALAPADGDPPDGAHVVDQPLEGQPLLLALRRVGSEAA